MWLLLLCCTAIPSRGDKLQRVQRSVPPGAENESSVSPGSADGSLLSASILQRHSLQIPAFAEFVEKYGKPYKMGTEEYDRRRRLYEHRAEHVLQHNSQPDRLWTASINKFADHTPEELAQLRGYRRHRMEDNEASAPLGFLSRGSRIRTVEHLPTDLSWQHLQAMRDVKDQRECGSCWAFASSTIVHAHSEIWQDAPRSCSVQQLLECTPNPHHCGGDGGCQGATAELALEYITQMGCMSNSQWPYSRHDGACPRNLMGHDAESSLAVTHGKAGSVLFGMTGYIKLPENRVEPLLLALFEQGPVAVSLAAGYLWNSYSFGIMDACPEDAVIDHAVTLAGFGEDRKRNYWLIQNSWGRAWGEQGFIRLERHSNDEENRYCGWDTKPEIGSGCKGGPSKVWVCGSCGILYDTAVPTFRSRTGYSGPAAVLKNISRQVGGR